MSNVITLKEVSGIKIVSVSLDEIDMFNIVEIIADLEEIIDEKVMILFDLDGIRFIDSSGLGGLIKIQRKLRAMQGKLALCNPADNIENLLRLTQTLNYLPCFSTLEDGIKKIPTYSFDTE